MMRPWPILLAVLSIALALTAPRSARAESKFDQITVLQNDASVTLWKIDRPNVTRPRTQYPSIKFHPGDDVMIFAGGCVQTGGVGRTWKSYTNPLGSSADVYYSGTIYIPGVIPFGADGGFQRIGGHIHQLLHVPDALPPTITPSQLFLQLGYQDDGYADNSYGAHDDGNYDQCKGVGAAWVQVRVTHPSAAAAQFTPWSKPFDVTWKTNSIDANGLPVNPFWAAQIDPKGVAKGDPVQQAPNFGAACGPAFSWNWGSHGLDEDVGGPVGQGR